jgi:hypothetical protein
MLLFAITATTDCAVCNDGYTRSTAHRCTRCSSSRSARGTVLLAVTAAVLALTLWYIVSYLLTIDDTAAAAAATPSLTLLCAAPMKFLTSVPWSKLRIPVVVFQILTQYISISGLRLPELYMKFLSWTRIFNLNVGGILSFACALRVSFYDRLLINTLLPIAVLLLLRLTYSTVQYREARRAAALLAAAGAAAATGDDSSDDSGISVDEQLAARLQRALTKHHTVFLVMTFLIYSTVSTAVFQTFACDVIEPTGESYLRADYSVSCKTREHHWYQVYAAIMVSHHTSAILSDTRTLAAW